MKRIVGAYSAKFRALLLRVGARNIDKGMQWFLDQARNGSAKPNSESLEAVYSQTRRRVRRVSSRTIPADGHSVVFVCDVGLGGLARWLRAAGYMAHWREGVGDPELIEEAKARAAILLTTDSGMMERRVLRDGELPALWVSPGLTKLRQLESVLGELELPRLQSRCMECGGQLVLVDKEAFATRIPPRTYRWRNEYFLCQKCGKLFWHGSHWKRIETALNAAETASR